MPDRAVLVVSGIPGAGKSTVAALVARRLARSVHIEAEALQRLVVEGSVWPDGEPREEARRQLRLRGRNVALLADSFFEAGFTPVVDDVVVGSRLTELRSDLRSRPLLFVLLLPRLDVVRERNRQRPNKDVFETWRHLDAVAREHTPRVGMRLDTSDQNPEESAEEILRRAWQDAIVPGADGASRRVGGARYVHTNLIARDWQSLARFYQDVFGCVPVPPERDYAGPQLEAGTGLPGARLHGVHLRLPGHGPDGPTLEIFQYAEPAESMPPAVNRPGLAHVAFAVDDVPKARATVLAGGGSSVGEIVTLTPSTGARVTWCYVTDPEGNLLELQSWSSG